MGGNPKRAKRSLSNASASSSNICSIEVDSNTNNDLKKGAPVAVSGFLYSLVAHTRDICFDEDRCRQILQSLANGSWDDIVRKNKVTATEVGGTRKKNYKNLVDGYWILLVTHLIWKLKAEYYSSIAGSGCHSDNNNMMIDTCNITPTISTGTSTRRKHSNAEDKNNKTRKLNHNAMMNHNCHPVIIVTSFLSYCLSRLVATDRVELERACSTSARSLLCRAILTSTVNSCQNLFQHTSLMALNHLILWSEPIIKLSSTTAATRTSEFIPNNSSSKMKHPKKTRTTRTRTESKKTANASNTKGIKNKIELSSASPRNNDKTHPLQHEDEKGLNECWGHMDKNCDAITKQFKLKNWGEEVNFWNAILQETFKEKERVSKGNTVTATNDTSSTASNKPALSQSAITTTGDFDTRASRNVDTSTAKAGSKRSRSSRRKSSSTTVVCSSSTSLRKRRNVASCADPSDPETSSIDTSDKIISEAFEILISKYPLVVMKVDGRIAVRRWASMAYVWLCQGQQLTLEVVIQLLQDQKSQMSQKNTNEETPSNSSTSNLIISNVNLACRYIDIVTESSNSCSPRPPTGGMENYVRSLLEKQRNYQQQRSTAKKTSTRSSTTSIASSKKSKPSRPDIRNIATVVAYQLIQAHFAIPESATSVTPRSVTDRNAEEIITSDSSNMNTSSSDFSICATIQSLCAAAAASSSTTTGSGTASVSSSSSSNKADQASWTRRFLQTASFWMAKKESFYDLKLWQFAITQWKLILESTITASNTSSGGSSSSSSAQKNENAKKDDVSIYHLNEFILTPELKEQHQHQQQQSFSLSNHVSNDTLVGIWPSKQRQHRHSIKDHRQQKDDDPELPLSLLLRAFLNRNKEGKEIGEENPSTPAALVSNLIYIVKRCYENDEAQLPISIARANVPLEYSQQQKRTTKARSVEGPNCHSFATKKRRKLESGQALAIGSIDEGNSYNKSEETVHMCRPISCIKAELARVALDTLSLCFASPTSSILHRIIHDAVTAEHLLQIVQLAPKLDEIILQSLKNFDNEGNGISSLSCPRESNNSNKLVPATSSSSSSLDEDEYSPNFTPAEKKLWSSHMTMCSILGCGNMSISGNSLDDSSSSAHSIRQQQQSMPLSVLRGESRLKVFREMTNKDDNWPLRLPSAHRALIASNLTLSSLKNESNTKNDTIAERYIVDGMLQSIGEALSNNLQILEDKTPKTSDPYIDDCIPLSLQDTRLFLVAACMLPVNDCISCLSKLVSILQSSLQSICNDTNQRSKIAHSRNISGFISRIMTLCSNYAVLVAWPNLQDSLIDLVSRSQYPLPSFSAASTWYQSDTCFMGVLSDWENCTFFSTSDGTCERKINRTKSITKSMISAIELAFTLGFDSAKADSCHLLYAAWNAMGNRPLWDASKIVPPWWEKETKEQKGGSSGRENSSSIFTVRSGSANTVTRRKKDKKKKDDKKNNEHNNWPILILQMRESICHLHYDIRRLNGTGLPEFSLLLHQALNETNERCISSSRLKKNLQAVVGLGSKFILSLLNSYVVECKKPTSDDQSSSDITLNSETPPASAFSAIEAASIYIAYAISSCTKSNSDFFPQSLKMMNQGGRMSNSNNKRPRGYSSESDNDPSDMDSADDTDEDDPNIKALSQLREACEVLGGAPIHPDWIDTNCTLQDGITTSDAREIAESSVKTLTNLFVTAFSQYKRYLAIALQFLAGSSDISDAQIELAIRLCILERFELPKIGSGKRDEGTVNNSSGSDSREWRDDIGAICEIDTLVIDTVLQNVVSKKRQNSKEAWCHNAAQRILGPLKDRSMLIGGCSAELRANGEWEVLLGETLTSACRDSALQDQTVIQQPGAITNCSESEIKGYNALQIAAQWRGICETSIDCLVPASALLRYGLSGARKVHPVNCNGPVEENNTAKLSHLSVTDHISVTSNIPKSLHDNINETLSTLALFCAECGGDLYHRSACQSIATHLLAESKSFSELYGIEVSRFAFTTLSLLHDIVLKCSSNSSSVTTEIVSETIPHMVDKLASIIEYWGCSSSGTHGLPTFDFDLRHQQVEKGLGFGQKYKRLFSSLGVNGIVKIDTITSKSIEPRKILSILDNNDKFAFSCNDGLSLQQNKWKRQSIHYWPVIDLVKWIFSDNVDRRTKSRFALILNHLAILEYYTTGSSYDIVIASIIKAFNGIENEKIEALLCREVCSLVDDNSDATTMHFCSIFAFLLLSTGNNNKKNQLTSEKANLVISTLINTYSRWRKMKSSARKYVLDLLFLYCCFCGRLHDIGSTLISGLSLSPSHEGNKDHNEEGITDIMEPLVRFLNFLQEIRACTTKKLKKTGISSKTLKSPLMCSDSASLTKGSAESTITTVVKSVPRDNTLDLSNSVSCHLKPPPHSCSFALKSGFHGQHWYNCYTCGLTWDKGCCTLCALVCHRGHDVSYSRYSSFFCDCGAEDGASTAASERNRVSCKCLSPLAEDDINSVFGKEGWDDGEQKQQPSEKRSLPTENWKLNNKRFQQTKNIFIEIAKDALGNGNGAHVSSLDQLVLQVQNENWFNFLFTALQNQFELWKSSTSGSDSGIGSASASNSLSAKKIKKEREETSGISVNGIDWPFHWLRQLLHRRNGKGFELRSCSSSMPLIPIRVAKAGSFQLKLSSDESSDRLKRATLLKNQIYRSALVADSRGRLIIAEPSSIVFCAAAAAVNVRYVHNPTSENQFLSRSSMCILGSSAVKFNVVGMRLCRENERHLAFWGTSEVSVAVIKSSYDSIERTIELPVDVDLECDADYLVKCEWVPGSQTMVAVGCCRFICIFDIARTDSENRALPIISFSLGYEMVLRDITILPANPSIYDGNVVEPPQHSKKTSKKVKKKVAKMYVLLQNGKLHCIDLQYGANDSKLDVIGERHFESSESITLPIVGVRMFKDTSAGTLSGTSKSLGEGSTLSYLSQSRLLLYKCDTSSVLALTLCPMGRIKGSFELLPHVISSDILGKEKSDGHSITGPYTCWTELGVVKVDGNSFFQVSLVGRSLKTNQPRLLVLQFNEFDINIKEISWNRLTSASAGLSLCSSFEGVAAFSVPYLRDVTPSSCNASKVDGDFESSRIHERAILSVVTSNGCLLLYGENMSAEQQNESCNLDTENKGHEAQDTDPSFPLTIFERLTNVTDSDCVLFGGNSFGSDHKEIKKKLARDNTMFLMSPRREGCSLIVSIQADEELGPAETIGTSRGSDENAATQKNKFVIAAVRILVGSTASDCIPRKFVIEGRPVHLTPGLKKWYSLPLTDEEIALSIRNGFTTIGISQSFDSSNNSLIDAVEIYATEREKISSWVPNKLLTSSPPSELTLGCFSRGNPCYFALVAQAVTHLCDFLGAGRPISHVEQEFLKNLVQETALEKDKVITECVMNLLDRLYSDSQSRKAFYDEGVLFGCSKVLARCKTHLEEAKQNGSSHDDTASLDAAWYSIRTLLRKCLRVSAHIARCRPINYLKATEKIAVSASFFSGSVAANASKLIEDGIQGTYQCEEIISDFVELSLMESAIASHTDTMASQADVAQRQHLASFDTVRRLLESDNLALVEKSCEAISSFCRKYGGKDVTGGEKRDIFAALQGARIVAYQCDSCSLFPMKTVRYTLLEDDHDIDLCRECYQYATKFAEEKNFDCDVSVKIKGKVVGGAAELNCAQIKMMQPVTIPKDVEEVEESQPVLLPSREQPAQYEDVMDEREDLQKALSLSLGSFHDEKVSSSSHKGNQSFEDFVGGLFSSVVDLLASSLKNNCWGRHFGSLIELLIDLIHNSSEDKGKLERAKQLAIELASGVSRLLSFADLSDEKQQYEKNLTLVICLRGLTSILIPGSNGNECLPSSQHDVGCDAEGNKSLKGSERTKAQVSCIVHGVPANRRRCAGGVHKDRRFYICGLERSLRCKFFVWADQVGMKQSSKPRVRSQYDNAVSTYIWQLFSMATAAQSNPLHAQLCLFLEQILLQLKSNVIQQTQDGLPNDGSDEFVALSSLYDERSSRNDEADGVFCSRTKLQDVTGEQIFRELRIANRQRASPIVATVNGDINIKLIESSLELLALVTSSEANDVSKWFSLLCEIIGSPNKSASLRSLAKRVLKQLCGGKRDLYHSVRDHYVFGFQIRTLIRNTKSLLNECLLIKEMARQSGLNWKNSERSDWSNLAIGGFLGMEGLISEDYSSSHCDKIVSEILDELWTVGKNRGENWRQFCGLKSLMYRNNKKNEKHDSISGLEQEEVFGGEGLNSPPIVSLFWIACALDGVNQMKAFKLVDLALTNWKERKKIAINNNGSSSDVDVTMDKTEEHGSNFWFASSSALPEDIFLSGRGKLDVNEIYAFIIQFTCKGKTTELRRVSCSIAARLCRKLSPQDLGRLLCQLLSRPLCKAGELGKTIVEFLNLLQSQLRYASIDSMQVTKSAGLVMSYFQQQFQAIKYDRMNGEWISLESCSGPSFYRKRFDLAKCQNCHRLTNSKDTGVGKAPGRRSAQDIRESIKKSSKEHRNRTASSSNDRESSSSPSAAQSYSKRPWLPEQVSPYTRGRLEGGKESSICTNNEFCTFLQLKCRLAISEIHLTVNDPRGRFVKTIAVYFAPRPVNDVKILKSDDYAENWQLCATLNLTRGVSRASRSLTVPVVAANLKIEYIDFYERPGGSRTSDGSFMILCPRCTRVVNNAHGVCGNCGEVAYQCRKCRHINYDRLDAFLCVECGYCASGSFSFELIAGVASNSVAITNDEEYDRTLQMLRSASRSYEDLRTTLKKKLGILTQHGRKSKGEENAFSSFSPGLKQAFLGTTVPKSSEKDGRGGSGIIERVGKKGWVVKTIARPGNTSDRSPGTSDRTRSLLRLARQLRTESSSPERRRSGDVMIRHLGRGSAIEALDEDGDLMTLLEGGGSGGGILDPSDPLSRLLASFHSSRRGRSVNANEGGSNERETTADCTGDENGGGEVVASNANRNSIGRKSDSLMTNKGLEECEKMYVLMREAECECHELGCRIKAWNRLEEDELAESFLSSTSPNLSFSPSHCSLCSGAVALQLLVLWLRLFQAKPTLVEISSEFVQILLEENAYLSKALLDLKKAVVREIATKSPKGTKLVLEELGARLLVTRDVVCAEILGKIIESRDDFPLYNEYMDLTLQVLENDREIN